MKKLFYLLPFTIFCSFIAKAQTIDTSFIYDFSGNAGTLQSEITAVYAEEDIILVAGHVQRTGEPQRFYTAAFDYNGQLLWHKEPQLPAEWAHNELAEFDNLKKYKDKNEYIIGGSIHNTTTNPGYDILQPFIYTFNKDGDSIKFERVSQNSDTTQKLSTLNIDEDNNVLIAGNISDKFALDTISGLMTMDSNGMWYAKYNNQIIWKKTIYIQSVFHYGFQVHNFLHNTDRNDYALCASLYKDALRIYSIYPININDGKFMSENRGSIVPDEGADFVFVGLREFQYKARTEMSVLKRRIKSGFFVGCSVIQQQNLDIIRGLMYCNMPTFSYQGVQWGAKTVFINNNISTDTILWDNGGIRLGELKNGDILLAKKGTYKLNLWGYEGVHVPLLMRLSADGSTTRWKFFHNYLPNADTNISQHYNSISVTQSGKIVLGGYLKSWNKSPGVLDTTGTLGWLTIISDPESDKIQNPNSIVETAKQNELFSIYPNPVSDILTIEAKTNNTNNATLIILDINGRQLLKEKLKGQKQNIDISTLPKGLYVVEIMQNNKSILTQKISKQ